MKDAKPGQIPPGSLDEEAARPRVPPPARPQFSGVGMLVGAGVTFVVAIVEQSIAHRLVARECIEPAEGADIQTAEDFGNLLINCAPGLVPAAPLRIHSDVNLIATVALTAAGAGLRGHRDAWDDVFRRQKKSKRHRALSIAGATLIPVGFASWLITSAAAWKRLGSCTDASCAIKARLMAFTTRDASVAVVAAGAGMLAYGLAYNRSHGRFAREKALTVAPQVSWQSLGLQLRGKF